MPMLTDKSNSATIEDSTPVNNRLLKKALSPPITIKNFFKPSSKASDPCVLEAKAECSSDSTTPSLNDKPVFVEEDTQTSCESESTKNTKTTSQYFVKSMSKSNDKGNNSAKSGTKLKRTAESSLTRKDSAKRCKKQGNILSSLQNSNRQRKECPICQVTFSATANNKEINDHMDSCLIE
jgi:hypothetical protein